MGILERYLTAASFLITAFPSARNFNTVTKISAKSKKKRNVAEAVVRQPGEKDVVNANKFVTQMLAASLGLKMCDVGRRILLYTKANDKSKGFYALCRGVFPIQGKPLLDVHLSLTARMRTALLLTGTRCLTMCARRALWNNDSYRACETRYTWSQYAAVENARSSCRHTWYGKLSRHEGTVWSLTYIASCWSTI